jgi:hypothetical protein
MIARAAVALAAVALATALAVTSAGGSAPAQRPFDAKCGVFPEAAGVGSESPSLPDQRAWNQDVSDSPVAANSDEIIDHINASGGTELHPDFGSNRKYGIPFRVVGKRVKPVRVRFTAYGDESDKGRYRIPLKAPIEGGAKADGDRHAIAYDRAGCKLYELYRAFPKRGRWEADSGAIWNLRSADLRREGWTSADAAGLPIFPGLVRYDEVRAGEIDHALRMTFESTRDAWINPASHCAGDTSSPDAPPMGMRLRLKSSFDSSGFRGQSAVIVKALKQYGVIVADNGSNWYFQGGSDRRWNDDDLNQLKEIPGGAFEVVRSEAEVHVC